MWPVWGLYVQGPLESLISSVCAVKVNCVWSSHQLFGDVRAYAFPLRDIEMIRSTLGGKE